MNLLLHGLKRICFILIMALVVLLGVNVVMRYVVRSPFDWTEEAGQLILIWLTFLGGAIAAAEKRHMGMDLFVNYFKNTPKKIVELIISLVVLFCLGVIVYYGIDMTVYNWDKQSESLHLPYALFYGAIPVGCLLYIVFELSSLKSLLKKNHKPLDNYHSSDNYKSLE